MNRGKDEKSKSGIFFVFALIVVLLILFNLYDFMANKDTFEYRGFETLLNTFENIGNEESLLTIESWKEIIDDIDLGIELDIDLPENLEFLQPVLDFFLPIIEFIWIPIKFLVFLVLSIIQVFIYIFYFIEYFI